MNNVIEIERMIYGPEAIGHLPDGKAIFVRGAAPKDRVSVKIIEDKKNFARGKIVEILEPSPSRIVPKSPIDAISGIAPWQHLTYEAQLEAKRQNIVGALIHTAHMTAEKADSLVQPCIESPHKWNYRNKLELTVGTDAQKRILLGFHEEGTDSFLPADSSKLAHKAIEKAPKALQGALRYAQGNRQDLGLYRVGLRHSCATGELEIALWTKPGAFPRNHFAKTLSTALPATSIVRVLANPGKARKIKGVEILDGRGYWQEELGQFDFITQAPSFFQVNTAQAERLQKTVLENLGDINGAYIADLYAGGGTFSIPLAANGADVVAVEAASSSVRDLRRNADLNQVEIECVGGDAARELEGLGKLDALVVDPPRAGLSASIIPSIAQANPDTFIYISCNPSTWARDVNLLKQNGYNLSKVIPVDMFPQTYHSETISFFSPEK